MNFRNVSKYENKNQINFKSSFDNLKCDYFLVKIFEYIKKRNHLKLLKVIKYCKKEQI